MIPDWMNKTLVYIYAIVGLVMIVSIMRLPGEVRNGLVPTIKEVENLYNLSEFRLYSVEQRINLLMGLERMEVIYGDSCWDIHTFDHLVNKKGR